MSEPDKFWVIVARGWNQSKGNYSGDMFLLGTTYTSLEVAMKSAEMEQEAHGPLYLLGVVGKLEKTINYRWS